MSCIVWQRDLNENSLSVVRYVTDPSHSLRTVHDRLQNSDSYLSPPSGGIDSLAADESPTALHSLDFLSRQVVLL